MLLHCYQDLITIFEQTFFAKFNTKLVKGDDEPVYLPADKNCSYHRIIFAHGFFASALHEVSHWCIAGKKRRLLEDFGYWYEPDGRDQKQQLAFEQVEIKPQAVEWALSVAANKDFDVSVDNLTGTGVTDRHAFKAKVFMQVQHYLAAGFPPQAQQLITALATFYQVKQPFKIEHFYIDTAVKRELQKISEGLNATI